MAWWKGYRGGTATKLWLDRHGDGEFQRLFPDERAPLESPLWLDDGATIGFASDRDGSSELWAATVPADRLPEAADLRRLTNTEFYVRHATSDGRRVVFQSGGAIWRWEGGAAAVIEIDLAGERRAIGAPADRRQPAPRRGRPRPSTVERVPSRCAARCRGSPIATARCALLASGSTARRRLPVVVNSGGDVAWVTDASGDDAIELWSAATGDDSHAGGGALGRVLELVAAPDGSLLAGASHDGRLWALTVATASCATSIAPTTATSPALTFSPDSRWLAWSHPGPPPLARIRLAEVADPAAAPIDVTPAAVRRHRAGIQHRRQVPGVPVDAQFRPDLRRLRVRPVVPQRLADPSSSPLAATTPSPFDPEVAGRLPAPPKDAGAAELGAAASRRRRRRARSAGRPVPGAGGALLVAARRQRRLRLAAGAGRRHARRRPQAPR